MSRFWRWAPWVTRVPLLAAVGFFLFLAGQWLVDPGRVAVLSASGVKLPSAVAVTNLRGTGALFVPLAGILVACLVSRDRILLGLRLLTTIVGGAFLVRCGIVLIDRPTALLTRIMSVEAAILLVSAGALLVETVRRRREEAGARLGAERGAF